MSRYFQSSLAGRPIPPALGKEHAMAIVVFVALLAALSGALS